MELDELKALLKDNMEKVQQEKTATQLAIMLCKKTVSLIDKLKRSLIIELIACIVFTIPCVLIAAFGAYTSLRIYFGIFAVVCILFMPLLLSLHKKTKQLGNTAMPIKSNLQTLVKLLKEYVKRYFQLTMVLIPLSICLAFMLGYNDLNLHNAELHSPYFPTFVGSGYKIA